MNPLLMKFSKGMRDQIQEAKPDQNSPIIQYCPAELPQKQDVDP